MIFFGGGRVGVGVGGLQHEESNFHQQDENLNNQSTELLRFFAAS